MAAKIIHLNNKNKGSVGHMRDLVKTKIFFQREIIDMEIRIQKKMRDNLDQVLHLADNYNNCDELLGLLTGMEEMVYQNIKDCDTLTE